jgi:hypothetical protein
MLLLNSRTITVDGITVFPDHADPDQFWYLPGPVGLAERGADKRKAFTFIKYKPAVVESGVKGGGFLTFEVNLRLLQALERKIMGKLSEFSANPRLAVAPFDDGTVKCVALNLEGSGGTSATPAPAGAFNAVEKILGATVPSLHGDNTASFSLTLSQEGAIILEQAFQQGTTPVGVVYALKFTGMRPALKVKITADMKRVYDHFSASLSGRYYFIKAGIEAGLEWLKQQGAIQIEVEDFTGAQDRAEKERWALDFFKNNLLHQWFEPTLTLDQTGADSLPLPGNPPANNTGGSSSSNSGASGATPSANPSTGVGVVTSAAASAGASSATTAPSPVAAHPPAALTITSTEPDPKPAGYDVQWQNGEGTRGTLKVIGEGEKTVRVGGQAKTLDTNGETQIDVPDGANLDVVVEYRKSGVKEETFSLFFDYEKPGPDHWSVVPPSAAYLSYLQNNPNPRDGQFLNHNAPPDVTTGDGNDLRNWIQSRSNRLQELIIDGHTSYEGRPQKSSYNLALSNRRRQVAVGIVGPLVSALIGGQGLGQSRAQNANRISVPGDNPVSHDRVAEITAKVTDDQTIKINARLSRPAAPTPPTPPTPPNPPTPPTPPTPPAQPEGIAGSPEVALKLKFVHQEEQKTITIHYNRAEAIQQTYAPQGFFGLLLRDLEDKSKHFVEVDLDDAFFRAFTVTLDAPIDFQRIGLTSAQVAIDYGDPADPATLKHGDFTFDADNHAEQKFEVFMNDRHDTEYRFSTQWHFDPGSDWQANRFTYELPARSTEDRTLLLNPFDQLGFLEVKVFPHQIDRGIIESIDVHLTYQPADAPLLEKTLIVFPDSQPQFWRVRLDDLQARSYTFRLVHHLKDGSTRETGPVTTEATLLPVDDPFGQRLELDFVPLFDPATTRLVFIDVEYDDAANNYHRQERLTLDSAARNPVHLGLALIDPAQRTFRFRLTFIGADNQMTRGAFIETSDTLIGVSLNGA